MGGYATTFEAGVYRAGEDHVLWTPRLYDPTNKRRGVIQCGGMGVVAATWFGFREDLDLMAEYGHVSMGSDQGGPETFGNDDSIAAVDDMYAYLTGAGGALGGVGEKVGIVGGSMGALVALNWARANLALVAFAKLIIPALDINDIYDNDRGGIGAAAAIAGAYPGGVATEAATWRTYATGRAANPTSQVCAKPSGTVAGDLLVAIVARNSVVAVNSVPSGWDPITGGQSQQASPASRYDFYSRVAGASEPADYTWGFTTNAAATRITIMRFDHPGGSPSVESVAAFTYQGGTLADHAGITTATDHCLAVWLCMTRSAVTATAPGAMTERLDEGGLAPSTEMADETRATAGATGARNGSTSASSSGKAVTMLAIAAPGSVPDEVAMANHSPVNFAAELVGEFPIHIYYSTDDAVCLPAIVEAFATDVDAELTSLGAVGHTDEGLDFVASAAWMREKILIP